MEFNIIDTTTDGDVFEVVDEVALIDGLERVIGKIETYREDAEEGAYYHFVPKHTFLPLNCIQLKTLSQKLRELNIK